MRAYRFHLLVVLVCIFSSLYLFYLLYYFWFLGSQFTNWKFKFTTFICGLIHIPSPFLLYIFYADGYLLSCYHVINKRPKITGFLYLRINVYLCVCQSRLIFSDPFISQSFLGSYPCLFYLFYRLRHRLGYPLIFLFFWMSALGL